MARGGVRVASGNGGTDGLVVPSMDGRTDGQTDRQTDARMLGRPPAGTYARTHARSYTRPRPPARTGMTQGCMCARKNAWTRLGLLPDF